MASPNDPSYGTFTAKADLERQRAESNVVQPVAQDADDVWCPDCMTMTQWTDRGVACDCGWSRPFTEAEAAEWEVRSHWGEPCPPVPGILLPLRDAEDKPMGDKFVFLLPPGSPETTFDFPGCEPARVVRAIVRAQLDRMAARAGEMKEAA